MLHRVFVYGTLRKGEGNHQRYLDGLAMTPARTAPGWGMASLGAYPAIYPAEFPGVVVGEVYEVDDARLEHLDRLEGYVPGGRGMYDREEIALEDGTEAWAYFMPLERVEDWTAIPSGDWKAWRVAQQAKYAHLGEDPEPQDDGPNCECKYCGTAFRGEPGENDCGACPLRSDEDQERYAAGQ